MTKKSHSVTLSHLLIPQKPAPQNQNHLYLNVFTDSVTFTFYFFFKKNFKNLNRKMLKLLSKKSSFFQNTGCMELHNISHWYVCNVHGKDKWFDFPGSQTPPTAKGICSLQSKVTSSSLCTYQNEGGLSTEIERGCSQTELLVLNSSVAKLDLHYF